MYYYKNNGIKTKINKRKKTRNVKNVKIKQHFPEHPMFQKINKKLNKNIFR